MQKRFTYHPFVIARTLSPVPETVALGLQVRATAIALLEDALRHVRDPAAAGHEKAVHETRKRIKELRALLRLLAGSLAGAGGQPVQPGANEALRRAADGLGGARDAAVVMGTLEKLQAASRLEAGGMDKLRQRLSGRRDEAEGELAVQAGGAFEEARHVLEALLEEAPSWQLTGGEAWAAIEPNLRRMYSRGRRAMRAALETEDAEPWHAWRRRAKDLRYALELLREAAPPVLTPAAELAKSLTDKLGEDHDLAVLADTVAGHDVGGELQGALSAAVQARRVDLQRQAALDGRWLYAERPRAFVRRLRAYWRAAGSA